MAVLIPAINAATEEGFREQARIFQGLGSAWAQVDVSDGILGVPSNLNLPSIVERELPDTKLDIHLMVRDAAAAVRAWKAVAPARLTIHVEAQGEIHAILRAIREAGAERGLALSPDTPVTRVEPYLEAIDLLLFVAVPPGKSGQTFDPATVGRVRAVRVRHPSLNVGVDGGITAGRIPDLLAAGATTIVVASAIFSEADPRAAYRELQALVRGA